MIEHEMWIGGDFLGRWSWSLEEDPSGEEAMPTVYGLWGKLCSVCVLHGFEAKVPFEA